MNNEIKTKGQPKVSKLINVQENQNKTQENQKTIEIGYQETYDKLPKIDLEQISQSEFQGFKKSLLKLNSALAKVYSNNSTFTIITSKGKYRFNRLNNKDLNKVDKYSWAEYHGFFDDLKLYVLDDNHYTDNLEFSSLVLIDSITNVRYNFINQFDIGFDIPLVSPNNRFLLIYNDYEDESFISVVESSGERNSRTFKEFASFKTDQWNIKEIFWINKNSFVVKGFKQESTDDKEVNINSYYKAVLY